MKDMLFNKLTFKLKKNNLLNNCILLFITTMIITKQLESMFMLTWILTTRSGKMTQSEPA